MDTMSAAGNTASPGAPNDDAIRLMCQHIAFPLLVGLTCHFTVEPGARRWHRTLRKSGWTPPPVAFPLVWLACYINLGFASYRMMKSGGGSPPQIAGYVGHVLCVNAWNPVFFGLRRLKAAAYLLAFVIATTPLLLIEIAFWDLLAAAILFPYYLWLLLLCHLSFYMAHHNPGPHFGFLKDEVMDMVEKNNAEKNARSKDGNGNNNNNSNRNRYRTPRRASTLWGLIPEECGIRPTPIRHSECQSTKCKRDKSE